MKNSTLSVICFFLVAAYACGPTQTKEKAVEESESNETEAVTPASQSVFFVSPANGDTVSTTFLVEMGVEGMEIQPAGEVNEGFGHHHILINQSGWPGGEIIPPTDTTIHFGKGQTQTELTLEPGDYTITLQFGDGVHRSYGESMAASIGVVVQ